MTRFKNTHIIDGVTYKKVTPPYERAVARRAAKQLKKRYNISHRIVKRGRNAFTGKELFAVFRSTERGLRYLGNGGEEE